MVSEPRRRIAGNPGREAALWRDAVAVTPERVARLLEYFETLRKSRVRIADFGISEELVDDDQTPVEWFLFREFLEELLASADD
jgi:hypothetical protein